MPPSDQGASVIICARNEYHNLKVLLPLLFKQQHPHFEVVVADDASSDNTRAFLLEQQRLRAHLTVVTIKERPAGIQPKKYALQRAIHAARHNRLVLTDADCRPASTHWLSKMSSPLREPIQVVLGYSPYFRQPGLLNRFIGYETLHTGLLYLGSALAGHPYMGVGRNLAYQKLFFERGKGFKNHQQVVGGDDDLWVNQHARRTNTAVVVTPETLVYSLPKTNLRDYFEQKTRHLHASQHYGLRDQLWLGILSFSTMSVWLAGILLLVLDDNWPLVIGLFLFRWLILAAVLCAAGRRLHNPINLALLPILDFLHVIYYIAIGTRAFATTNISWKN
jgi:cellulose synthase/poly-beta-1,6-N-acetylglucosamine synthase-like glycosyltransferase